MTLEKLRHTLKVKTKLKIGPEGNIHSNRQNAAGNRHSQWYAIIYFVSRLVCSLEQLQLVQN